MVTKKLVSKVICLLIWILLVGCSNHQSQVDPVTGINTNPDKTINSNPISIAGYDFNSNGHPSAGYGALGFFEININPDSMAYSINSMRSSGSTDVLEVVDISNFLQMAPCSDCVKISSIEINPDGNLVVYIGIKHPFDAGDPFKPISGKNRGDLHVFNVEGLVIAETTSDISFSGLGQHAAGFRLVNADGYSSYLDDSIDSFFATPATIHPYILHFDDYSAGNYNAANSMGFESVTDPPPSGNLVMAMGSDYDIQPYEFDLSGEDISFLYAVGCTYAVSADGKALRFTPEYRVPQHHKKAAAEVAVRVISNDLYDSDPVSSATYAIDIVDTNHDVAVGSALDEMAADSSVGAVEIEVPGVITGVQSVALTNTGGLGHEPSDPLTYEVTILNELSALEGAYPSLIKVTDSYPTGNNASPLLSGLDGINRVDPIQNPLEGLFAIDEFATYLVFDVAVGSNPNEPPTAILLPNPVEVDQFNTIDFDATTSSDTDGTVDLYEFDYDWDGVEVNFTADDSNTTGLVTSWSYDILGTFTAGLRVTDNLGGVDYDAVQVDVVEEVACATEAHTYLSTHNVTGQTFDGSFNANLVFFEAGPNAGKVLYMYRSTRLGMIDPAGSDQTIVPFNTASHWGANYYNAVDACPMTGRVIGAITNHMNIWDPNGTSLTHWQTNDQGYITTADIDDNGDLLAVIRAGTITTFRRFTYSAGAPYYNNVAVESYDLTSTYPASSGWVCIDFAIDYETDLVYMFWGRWPSGEYSVAAYDFDGTTANQLYVRNDVFTKNINMMVGGSGDGPFYGRRADMEIEHVTPERCRIVLAANTDYSGTYHYEIVRLDDELTLIDRDDSLQEATSIGNMPMCFTIADTPDHPMISIAMVGSTFNYYESTDW